MWSRYLPLVRRSFATSSTIRTIRATILGASTPAGIVASRILKTSDLVSQLRLHGDDLVRATCHDLCDVDTACSVSGHVGTGDLKSVLSETDVVLVAVGRGGGGPVTPAHTFTDNIPLVRDSICAIATFCPGALVVIASEPVNSMVPFAAEILTQLESFDPNRLLGTIRYCI